MHGAATEGIDAVFASDRRDIKRSAREEVERPHSTSRYTRDQTSLVDTMNKAGYGVLEAHYRKV